MSRFVDDFQAEARKSRPSLVGEFIGFLAATGKWWLLPILFCLALLAIFAIFANSGAAPFIYTLF